MSSKNHFFLVNKKIEQCTCQWTSYGENHENDIPPGYVVVIRPSNGENEFEVHRGAQFIVFGPRLVTREGGLPRDKVVPITGQEFDILLGTQRYEFCDDFRLELHTSGRLKWACQLKVDDDVLVKIGAPVVNIPGVIRGNATLQLSNSHYGLQFVVEITDEEFKYHFGEKHEQRMRFLCSKNCGIIVPVDQLYPPDQLKTSVTKEAANKDTNQAEAAAVEVKVKPSLSKAQQSRKRSLKEALEPIVQQYEAEMEQRVHELEDQVSKKEEMILQLNEQVLSLEGKLQEKAAQIEQQQAESEKLCDELKERQREIDTNKETSKQQLRDQQQQCEQQLRDQQQQCEQQLRDQQQQCEQQLRDQQQQHEQALAELRQQNERILRQQLEHHQQEVYRLQREQEQLHRQLGHLQQVMTDQEQQSQARIDTAIAILRGTSQVGFDAIELWEVPEEDVHVSSKILGTGGWGYVAEGTFRGQKVAVKCLHRGILSQFTTNHVRREISIMAQVRHPNLVLLIGAVLNADTGPLIITELLDRTLRSAYEEHLLEEHCKLLILRDVAAALSYLHLHRRPIIHRDVSSANVLLEAVRNNAWKAKLSDFGSANLIRLATTPAEGAVTYSAPEVRTEARNQQTPKVDVYSFGVLLCEVSLCRFPPDPREFAAFLTSVQDNTDPHSYELAQNCTKHDPEERPSMRDILTQIELIPH